MWHEPEPLHDFVDTSRVAADSERLEDVRCKDTDPVVVVRAHQRYPQGVPREIHSADVAANVRAIRLVRLALEQAGRVVLRTNMVDLIERILARVSHAGR